MFHSLLSRKLCLAVAAAGLFALAGCSNQATDQAANQAPNQPNQQAKAAPGPKKAAAPKAPAKAATPKVVPASAKVTQAGPAITVPKGTAITATMGQTLASNKNHAGDSFAASLASPIKVDGKTVLPKGAKVTGKVVAVRKHEIKVELASVVIHGKSYDLETNSLRPSDKIQAKSSSAAADKSSDKAATDKQKKDNSTFSAKSRLTFKLAKPVTVPVKG
jgi:FtsP/CotA-like multicopper oxidase with cupredoxin domain